MDGWLTTKEAAERLGLSRQAVTWMIREGRLKATKVGGQWFIREESLADVDRRPVGYPKGRPRSSDEGDGGA